MILQQQDRRDGIAFANASALIPLKAKAWLDFSARKLAGDAIDTKDITKHSTDVFRLATTLSGDSTVDLPEGIRADLTAFLSAFPVSFILPQCSLRNAAAEELKQCKQISL